MKSRTILLPDIRSPQTPTRVSVPFNEGELHDFKRVVIKDSSGRTVPSQGRSLLNWMDGSVKWGLLVFDPDTVSKTHSR